MLLSLASVVLTLLLGEVLLSVFFPQPTYRRVLQDSPPIFAPSDDMPYALALNSTGTLVTPEFRVQFKINALGYRGDEFQKHKTSRIRILAIGDSFTFGYAVASTDAYPSVLETELRRVLGTDDIEVINAGFAACNYPDTYYLYLKHRGIELNPDIIIVGVFVGNDLDHDRVDEREWTASDIDGLPLRIRSKTSQVTDGYWMSRHRQLRYYLPIVRDSHLLQARISALRPGGSVAFNQWMYRSEYENRTVEATLKGPEAALSHGCARPSERVLSCVCPDAGARAGLPGGVQPVKAAIHG